MVTVLGGSNVRQDGGEGRQIPRQDAVGQVLLNNSGDDPFFLYHRIRIRIPLSEKTQHMTKT